MVTRDKDGLFETLRSYLDLGSIAGVATETYRHRNTVRNRLQTVERVTGLDLSKPRDTALLAMAVDWLRSPAGDRFSHAFD
jgi:DNA-binding PucR family transcriptional regulator